MSDLTKSIIVMVLTVVTSNIATTSKLSADIDNLTKSVDKLDTKIDKLDERTRMLEIKQASYLALNN